MSLGYIMIFVIGACWCSVGVVFSRLAKNKIDSVSFMALSSIITTIVAFAILPKYDLLINEPSMDYYRAVVPTLGVGIATVLGVIAMNKAMRMGHHGATWALVQSALIVPFLFGVIVWGDSITVLNIAGLIIILISIVLFGIAKQDNETNHNINNFKWILISLSCLLFFGTQQTLMTLPSRWKNWSDVAALRVPFIQIGAMIGYNLLLIFQQKKFNFKVWKLASILTFFMIGSQLLLFKTLDLFAASAKAAIVFPMGIGVSMILFSLYSFLIIKEKATMYHVLGISIGIAGIIFVALK